MNRIIGIILMAAIGFFLANYIHWMAGYIVCILVIPLLKISSGQAFLIGFCTFFFIWAGYAFWADLNNDQILSEQMGTLFNLSPIALILTTGILGALPAGFLSWFVRTFLIYKQR